MKKLILGILAHVDAGKTTLSEAILYLTGATRKVGRVDKGDTFLDSDSMERARGITVFSKEARFKMQETEVTLVDTPGHADFSAEMERTLSILDLAVLVVSGVEGVQSHTKTLIKLFELYRVPYVIFINKMDMPGASFERTMDELKEQNVNAMDFREFASLDDCGEVPPTIAENVAACSERLMDEYFAAGSISCASLARAVYDREIQPVVSGSALKMEGIDGLLRILDRLSTDKSYPSEFSARVYKITRDARGNRLTHLKVTGGALKNKMPVRTSDGSDEGTEAEEKIEQIRLYNGDKFTAVGEAGAGMLCAVTGLRNTYGGQGLGAASSEEAKAPFIEPALIYTLILPKGEDPVPALQKMKQLEEEDPTLKVTWEERTGEIKVSVMGELEKDLLRYKIKERFVLDVSFGTGKVIYKETISAPVEGIGHYEPLRHYAEVRLLLEPLKEGSGLVFESAVSEDDLQRNWQNLIMKHLKEKRHRGTLMGCEITDMKITLTNGLAHLKHTEGGDFRQATYRAVRNGLRKALANGEVVLLEPMYDFTIRVPQKHIGRVMTDMDRLKANCALGEQLSDGTVMISGRGPVSTLREYQMELNSFSEGSGRFDPVPGGYGPCHDTEEVAARSSYDCDTDVYNPCGSVFTDHGAGVYVDWDEVEEIAHTEGGLRGLNADLNTAPAEARGAAPDRKPKASDDKTLNAIFEKTYGKSKRDEQLLKEARSRASRLKTAEQDNYPGPNPRSRKGKGRTYLIIDGYNLLFAWDEFRELREANIDGARESLIEVLQNYQGFTGSGMTLVFDGYRLKGNAGETVKYGDLEVVYTGEGLTADRYIEKFIYENGRKYDVTVVTSDRMVQMSAMGDGAGRMSARDLYLDVTGASEEIRDMLRNRKFSRNRPFEEAFSEK
ncbi:MAG: TetM/TetW/TetO/TetS family tetracycline resistance ribosomal protection protein [Firmicutes bacterium]|nr:TetM/TetW/TetO/TetS family tetracycline resistance ribosomal protection protein [Bacillota bacterium]